MPRLANPVSLVAGRGDRWPKPAPGVTHYLRAGRDFLQRL